MGRPRKRRRAEDEVNADASEDPLAVWGDDSLRPTSLEDILAAASSPNNGLEGFDKGALSALSWNPSQQDPTSIFDFSDWNLTGRTGDFFNENGQLPLHPPMPVNSSQLNVPSLAAPAGTATMMTQTATSEASTPNGPGCACLANLYLTLSSFQSLPPPSFPLTSGNLNIATKTARDVLRCPVCPTTFYSAFQNISLLGTLLPLIVMEYAKLLHCIDDKSAKGESITFRMGDQNPAHRHLHTGTPDCPLGFNIELSAPEWRMTARKAIRQQVHGVKPGDESFSSLLDELEKRQHAWHETEYPHRGAGYAPVCTHDDDTAERGCLRVVRSLRKSIVALNLSDESFNLS